ncbi:MAG: hypothetical protein WDM89_19705 [Rhizomicrobium sp.]
MKPTPSAYSIVSRVAIAGGQARLLGLHEFVVIDWHLRFLRFNFPNRHQPLDDFLKHAFAPACVARLSFMPVERTHLIHQNDSGDGRRLR